jgi:hypothetical protein
VRKIFLSHQSCRTSCFLPLSTKFHHPRCN